jgi:hydrogenase maturation protein HypF
MAENELPAPLLGVSWDGTGYGDDGAIWGGEFLRITHNSFARVGHLRTFRLPGGDQAVREPRRAGLGLLYAIYGEDAFSLSELPPLKAFTPAELKVLHGMLVTSTCSPETSSAGRLFDAVASITGLRQHVGFEGQAAMDLEFAFEPDDSEDSYPLPISRQRSKGSNDDKDIPSLKTMLVLDWGPMILRILEEMRRDVPVWIISARFHNALAEAIVSVARRVKEPRVVLTGGCFQNKYLLESAVLRLRSAGFDPYWHQRVPPNDGGIALGQVLGAARARLGERRPCV